MKNGVYVGALLATTAYVAKPFLTRSSQATSPTGDRKSLRFEVALEVGDGGGVAAIAKKGPEACVD